MRMKKRWAWIGGAVCLAVPLLLSSCGGKDRTTSPSPPEDLFSGPPPSQSPGTFTFSARGGNGVGAGAKGGAGGGIDVTPKADPGNVGDGSISDPIVSSSVLSQIFTVECITPGGAGEAAFSVAGSVLGNIGTAISDQEFVDAENRVRFTITTGFTTPWAIGDKFTFKGPPRIKLNGANVRLIKAESVDTIFTVPFEPIVLGSNPRTIGGNETITLVDQSPFCPNIHDVTIPGDNPADPATGLWVTPNTTLTLVPADGCEEGVLSVGFERDVQIEGRVTTTVTGFNKARLSLTTQRNLIVGFEASLDTGGGDSPTDGGNGGNIELTAAGKIILQGFIDSSGGNGSPLGGHGGSIFLTAGFDLFNTAVITTDGGTASSGIGGNAGEIRFTSNSDSFICSFKGMFNSGDLLARGGDGSTGGGKGGDISLEAGLCGRGNLINAGVLSADGGRNTTGTGSAGNGGEAGDLSLKADATLLNSGSLSANGGAGVGTGFFGGNGGVISITLANPQPDSIKISASISANGGEGQDKADGGAGSPSMTIDAGEGDLHLLNFISLDLSGGDGKSLGGDGGRLTITASNKAGSNGTLFNEPQIMAMGGEGTGSTGDGGAGGSITLSSAASLINDGEVILNGGSGGSKGGSGGSVHLASISAAGDLGKVLNTAKLSANGGVATSGTKGVGGIGGEVFIRAVKLAANQGAVTANGGDGAKMGGDAGIIQIQAFSQTANSGNLSADGGNANESLPDSKGGDGGIIVLSTLSIQAPPASNSGVPSVVQGTGSSTATPGQIQID